jgi:tetratricopeptide (TPR) repeat protein
MRPIVVALSACIALAAVLPGRHAVAAPGAPAGQESEDDRKAAAKLFGEGQKAYNAGDYRHAAESFEEAYKRAPRLAPLWNAARAWHKAREYARAANLYAKYLKLAPSNAPDRNSATGAMRDLEPRLARLEIHAASFESVTVDGAPIEELDDQGTAVVYVTPGAHAVEGTAHGKKAREKPDVQAGSSSSVVLQIPETPVVVAPVPQPPPEEKHSGWSPVVVAVGGGLTAVGLGLTIWSGLDTLAQRQTFESSQTQLNLDDGRSKQLRTNVFIGVTAGVAALTTVAAIFLVDWKGHKSSTEPSTQVGFGLGGMSVRGTF